MIEKRLDRIENLIIQLIQMVAENNKTVKNVEQRMERMEGRMDRMGQRFTDERELHAQRHKEVIKELRYTGAEIDYLRNQTAKHDMEIHVLKENQ